MQETNRQLVEVQTLAREVLNLLDSDTEEEFINAFTNSLPGRRHNKHKDLQPQISFTACTQLHLSRDPENNELKITRTYGQSNTSFEIIIVRYANNRYLLSDIFEGFLGGGTYRYLTTTSSDLTPLNAMVSYNKRTNVGTKEEVGSGTITLAGDSKDENEAVLTKTNISFNYTVVEDEDGIVIEADIAEFSTASKVIHKMKS